MMSIAPDFESALQGNRQRWGGVMINRKAVSTALAIVLVISIAGHAMAQSEQYPTRALRLIVPFSPGGSVDTIARMLGAGLAENLGQQVIIDNRSGASGSIGTEIVARSVPDGYTLLLHTIPFVANTYLYRSLPYDVIRDFEPVILVSSSPSLLAVHPSLPVHSVRDLLKLARTRPGVLNYATAGAASNPHIAGELFNYLGKVNLLAVHFKGGGPGLIATISGEVSIGFSNFSSTIGHVKAGKLRGIGVSSPKRVSSMPELPTIAESGLPGYEFVAWFGLVAPKGTPGAVLGLLNRRIREVLSKPEYVKRFGDRGLEVIASSQKEFSTHLNSELSKWGRVIKERGMRAD
jgi:tripartite-type tricarboxylate transporter receptor subunit TctC